MCFFSIFSQLHWVIQHHDVHGTKKKNRFLCSFEIWNWDFLKKTCRVIRVNNWFASRHRLKAAIMDVAEGIQIFPMNERTTAGNTSSNWTSSLTKILWSLLSCLSMNCFRIDFILRMCHRKSDSVCHPRKKTLNLSAVKPLSALPRRHFSGWNQILMIHVEKSVTVVRLQGFLFGI